jgi:hypothetical protein
MLERWAYAYSYDNESPRLDALAPALDFHNRFRPHRALNGSTPLQRVNNVPGTNSKGPRRRAAHESQRCAGSSSLSASRIDRVSPAEISSRVRAF